MMVYEAHDIDKKNENTLWLVAIQKEMGHVKIAFQMILMIRSHPMGFSISTAIWCLTLKWRISKERHA